MEKLENGNRGWITDKMPKEAGKYWITTDTVQRNVVETDIGEWDGSCWNTFASVYAWKPIIFPEPFNPQN
jgi:hypothetical protein|nr:MAG TPA: hypothetical protein [Caudoviricetes sp.]